MRKYIIGCLMVMLAVFHTGCGSAPAKQGESSGQSKVNTEMILATTTSTQDSGLLDVLLPVFVIV